LLPKTCNFTLCSIFSNSGHVCWPNGIITTKKRTIKVFLAHLTQRVMWGIAIAWRPSSVSVVRRPSVNFSYAILPYVLFLVTAAMFVGRMELNEEVL
jgi:hypothetical protein